MRRLLSILILIVVLLPVTAIWPTTSYASIATNLAETKHVVLKPIYPEGSYQKAFFLKRKGGVKEVTKGVRGFLKKLSLRSMFKLRKAARSIGRQAQKLTGSVKKRPRAKQIVTANLNEIRTRTIRRARKDIISGDVFNRTKLRPGDTKALIAYRNNELGQTAKKLSPRLATMKPAQLRKLMKDESAGGRAVYTQQTIRYRGNVYQKQHSLEYSDGTVIRHKEKGDNIRNYPTYSVEVKVDKLKPVRGQNNVAFKVNNSGKSVPKSPNLVKPPSDMTVQEKRFYLRALGDEGHRGFQQVRP